jgi:hypothetical protein
MLKERKGLYTSTIWISKSGEQIIARGLKKNVAPILCKLESGKIIVIDGVNSRIKL